jgi:S1-C subfamily serine protease
VESVGQGVVQVERRGGSASGIIWMGEGLIITPNHVLTRDENFRVGLPDGALIEAVLVGRDPATDLALLRVKAELKSSLTWVGVEDLRVGHLVLALARPGRTVRAGLGIISVLGEGWRTPAGGTVDRYLQIDVPAYPGFSGGPLVTADGNVAGINTSGLIGNTLITVPMVTIKSVVEELLKRGHVTRGYLGVGIQPVRIPPEIAQQLGQEAGLLVTSVDPGSPAERAGIVLGDTLLLIDGNSLRHWDDLLALLGKDQIDVTVTIRVLRVGHLHDIKATIMERN